MSGHSAEIDLLAATVGLLPDCSHPTSRGVCPNCIAQAVMPHLAEAWDRGALPKVVRAARNPYRVIPPSEPEATP